MILIIGAEASGKREFAKGLGYAEKDFADAALDEKRVVYNVQNIVFDDPDRVEALYNELIKKDVVICNEVGSGIIPVDRTTRLGREAAGIQERLAPERVNRLWQEYFERIMNKKGKGAAS